MEPHTGERPPRRVKHPVMYQDWNALTFLHWRYEPAVLRGLLPQGLSVDVFDGSAWIGITPFRVENLRPPIFPAVPWLSTFPETNVRTYVRGGDGSAGIWFFSLEADRMLAVMGARMMYGLPYRWAKMRVDVQEQLIEYCSQRHSGSPAAASRIRTEVGEPIQPDDLEVFLTARFRLYTVLRAKLAFADVEHEPWPLQRAQTAELKQDLIQGSGLPAPRGEPLVHYSNGVHVRIGRPVWAE